KATTSWRRRTGTWRGRSRRSRGPLAGTDFTLRKPAASLGPMRVTEIYKSIQGESTYAGLPCTLVRFTGCNLRCVWCDTAYAFHGGEERSREEIRGEVRRLGVPL